MFFEKTKRIKQLEEENEELRRLTNMLRNIRSYDVPIGIKSREVKTYRVEKIITAEIGEAYRVDLIKEYLADELSKKCPDIIIADIYDSLTNSHVMRASIDIVVKER